ncbi:MAG: ATP-dependent zinc metalloprotease FtsH [Anaerolineae bacterium]|nr:ATP-dependent zinc metalloprotease FtsH [Anaerolineae bacterium]
MIGVLVLLVGLYAYGIISGRTVTQEVSLPEVVSAIESGSVEKVMVQGDTLTVTKTDGTTWQARKESNISTVEALQILGAPVETLKTLPIIVQDPGASLSNVLGVVITFLPLLFIGYIVFRVARQMQGGSGFLGLPTRMGRSSARIVAGANAKDEDAVAAPQVTFDDVAGAEQAKLELQEVVEFLKEPEKFLRLGARIPRGVLMAGPPGTGKTLMAKAIAGEAGVPFFSISGSEFVEMFVGVGASRVRDLFKRAREQAPAVIFVDEIDAVGRQRGVGLGGGNDEREQTLNQILVEMDGFSTDTNLIIIAATNRPDVLDPALLRPGRFDRKVILDRPDVTARQAILRVHTRGKPLSPEVKLTDLARLTPGFVGADLENLVNEAAIYAARRNQHLITQNEFQDAMERIVAGPERKGKIISDHEREVVAYHEAGHAVVMHNLPTSDPVHKVSITSRGMALGYTMPLPEGDKYLRTKGAFEDEIIGLLGGRAAEEIIFNEVTTGASNDLERATKLARAMVTRYGFSHKLGLRTYGEEQGNPYLGSMGESRNYSDEMALSIDKEIQEILSQAYQRAKQIITEQRGKLETLAVTLLDIETVERPQFEAMMA